MLRRGTCDRDTTLLATQQLGPLASRTPDMLGVVLGMVEHTWPLHGTAVESRVE